MALSCDNPELMQKQLQEDAGLDFAVLWTQVAGHVPSPEDEAVVAAAANGYMADSWLAPLGSDIYDPLYAAAVKKGIPYPYWTFDGPATGFASVSEDIKSRIMGGNAADLYKFADRTAP